MAEAHPSSHPLHAQPGAHVQGRSQRNEETSVIACYRPGKCRVTSCQ